MTQAEITTKVREAMRKGIKSHPKAKLWAEVNCQDNFASAMLIHAEHCALGWLSDHLDNDREVVNWLNTMCQTEKRALDILAQRNAPSHKSDFDILVLTTCRDMYNVLRA